jgi:hypothetical protein
MFAQISACYRPAFRSVLADPGNDFLLSIFASSLITPAHPRRFQVLSKRAHNAVAFATESSRKRTD